MKIGYYYVWAGVVLNLIISIDGKHGCIWLCDNTNINNSTSINAPVNWLSDKVILVFILDAVMLNTTFKKLVVDLFFV